MSPRLVVLLAILATAGCGSTREPAAPLLFGFTATRDCLEAHGVKASHPFSGPSIVAARGSRSAYLEFFSSAADAAKGRVASADGDALRFTDAVRNVVAFYDPPARLRRAITPCLGAESLVPADQVMVGVPPITIDPKLAPAQPLAAGRYRRVATHAATGIVELTAHVPARGELGLTLTGAGRGAVRGEVFVNCFFSPPPGAQLTAQGFGARFEGRLPARYRLHVPKRCGPGSRPYAGVIAQTSATSLLRATVVAR
jgi:hypothetical protein